MKTGTKIFIGVLGVAVIGTVGYLIYNSITDGKEKEVREEEKEKFGEFGDVIEMARKKHPDLAMWYDSLTLTGTKAFEDGWAVMTEEQKQSIVDGLKQVPMAENTLNFFIKKGFK